MRLTRHFPKSYETLRDLTVAAVGNARSVVFQAGHFLLIFDEQSFPYSHLETCPPPPRRSFGALEKHHDCRERLAVSAERRKAV